MAKRILVIDDDYDARHVYCTMLRFAGYDVSEAATGEDGMEAAAAQRPDLVVLDVGLPGITGWEVCSWLKNNPETAAAKIIIVTAHAFIEEEDRARECGAELLLTKPASLFELREEVAKMIGSPQRSKAER